MFVTISEFNSEAAAGLIPVLRAPEIVQPRILIGDASVQSAAFNHSVVRIAAHGECLVAFGADPDAAAGGELWPNGHVEVRVLQPGSKVAVAAAWR